MRRIFWLFVPAMLALAVPADARPRDDALSGTLRCGVIADSRQWLDCFYGAAQPVRAALGLAPALAGQIGLATSPPSGGAPRDATVRDQVVAGAAGCMRETADRQWLDCYYASAMPMRVQLGLSAPQGGVRPVPAPAPQLASMPAPPAPVRPAGPPPMPKPVGILGGLFTDPKPVVHDVPMQSYVFDKNGAFTDYAAGWPGLATNSEDEIYHRARWRRPASQMLVTIKPDAMHTFILTLA